MAGNGVELTFTGGVTSSGQAGVIQSIATAPPPTGYQIAGLGPFNWDINTTAGYTPPITVCISYAALLGPHVNEPTLRLWHYEGSQWVGITSDLCMSTGACPDSFPCISPCPQPATICGQTNSLSPFAIFQAIDATGPVMSGVPDTIVAYATSTGGATVTYALPTAMDDVDGPRPVDCSHPSGALFPPGRTTVTCSASDVAGNTTAPSFVVWVQYQAPADDSFFLRPIRPDGSSVFRVGRPVPVRFRLSGASAGITNLTATLTVNKISDAVQGTADDVSDETVEDTDFTFKYRPLLRLYAYRWKTRDESAGTYRLSAELGDGVTHAVNVSLRRGK
jgi:hypothetical protein